MDYRRFITPDTILVDVDEDDRDALLDRMIGAILATPWMALQPRITADAVREALADRPDEGLHLSGHSAVIVHARVPGLRGMGLCVAVPRGPVAWDAACDPVGLVVLALFPESRPTLAVKVLARIERLSTDVAVRALFAHEKDPSVLCDWLRDNAFEVEIPLTAADLMREPIAQVTPDTPLVDITRRMVAWNLDAIGIVDADGAVVGEIVADHLFTLGMPDFFSQLKSISFIAEYDPFEKYFAMERDRTAADVMSSRFATVTEDATVLEVVFLLAVRKHAKVYVTRAGRLVGVIDRIRVIDRILNI